MKKAISLMIVISILICSTSCNKSSNVYDCPSCEEQVEAKDRFCSNCGISLSETQNKSEKVKLPDVPLTLSKYSSIFNELTEQIRIDSIEYECSSSSITFKFTGIKTYGEDSLYSFPFIFNWRLYDSDNYIIETGVAYLPSDLSLGDKFKNVESSAFIELNKNENYRLEVYCD